MSRALLIVGILVAMLVIPIYIKKGGDDKQEAKRKAEVAASRVRVVPPPIPAQPAGPRGVGPGPAQPPAGPGGIGYGLTFGLEVEVLPPFGEPVALACRSNNAPLDRPHQGACNQLRGDTSCRMVLPLLCAKPGATAAVQGPDVERPGKLIGATRPVMGAVLESHAFASARCEKELGQGWRAADTQDSLGATLNGVRDTGLVSPSRFWVVSKGSDKGNCWGSDP